MREPATRRRRPILVRHLLGTLLATAALAATAGCGSDTSSAGAGGCPTWPNCDGRTDGPSPGPIAGAEVLPMISQTGGGGRVSTTATLLDTSAEVRGFTRQLQPAMVHRVTAAIAQARQSGYLVYGAVVALGCDRPPGADVALGADGQVQIVAQEVASPLPECLAPVTTVAIATVPGAQ